VGGGYVSEVGQAGIGMRSCDSHETPMIVSALCPKEKSDSSSGFGGVCTRARVCVVILSRFFFFCWYNVRPPRPLAPASGGRRTGAKAHPLLSFFCLLVFKNQKGNPSISSPPRRGAIRDGPRTHPPTHPYANRHPNNPQRPCDRPHTPPDTTRGEGANHPSSHPLPQRSPQSRRRVSFRRRGRRRWRTRTSSWA
jgi:hypothetical protein